MVTLPAIHFSLFVFQQLGSGEKIVHVSQLEKKNQLRPPEVFIQVDYYKVTSTFFVCSLLVQFRYET